MHLSLSLLFCTLPLVIAWGATLLILNELTPVFKLIEIPFESLLNFAGVPEADQISTAIVLAFVDQFLGAVVGLQCETEAAKFFCAAISFRLWAIISFRISFIWVAYLFISTNFLSAFNAFFPYNEFLAISIHSAIVFLFSMI